MAKTNTPDVTTTPEISGDLGEALLLAQQEISAGVSKDAVNPHFKSDYADRTSILQFVLPILNKHGIVLLQPLNQPSLNIIDHADQDYLYLTTKLIHAKSGEFTEFTAKCPLPKSDPQGYGSAVTYLSRYSIVSFFSLPLLDDDDGNQGSGRATGKSSPTTSTTKTSSTSAPKSSTTTAKTQASTTTKKESAATKSESAAKSAATTSNGADESSDAADPSVDDAATQEAETGKPTPEVAGAKPKGKLWGSKSAK